MSERQLRLFFALWPDADGATETIALARTVAHQSAGKATSPERIHLTLAFLGAQSPPAVDALRRCITAFDIAAFTIAFDHVGVWRKPGIAWLAPGHPPRGLSELNRAIVAAATPALRLPDDHPFSPHVTLARRVERRPHMTRLEAPVLWRVDAFSLVCSQLGGDGPTYTRIVQWQLAPVASQRSAPG